MSGADVRIRGNKITEGYVADTLGTEALDRRAALQENGAPVETFRRIGLDEALGI